MESKEHLRWKAVIVKHHVKNLDMTGFFFHSLYLLCFVLVPLFLSFCLSLFVFTSLVINYFCNYVTLGLGCWGNSRSFHHIVEPHPVTDHS